MLIRSLLRWFASPKTPQPLTTETESSVVLYAHFPGGRLAPRRQRKNSDSKLIQSIAPQRSIPKANRMAVGVGHRQRLLNMRLEHIRICSARRCQRLRELGVITAGDLAYADCHKLASQFNASRKALKVIQHYKRAIRFAASVPGMMPRDAMMLVSIHRRSVRGLASESASILYRDLQRFSESSQGQAQIRGRRLPSTRRLRKWIELCGSLTPDLTMRTRAA